MMQKFILGVNYWRIYIKVHYNMDMMQKFILGVNYWPRKKGIFWWKYFDAQEVKREFDQIKSIGLDTVRIFLLWEDFQPKADKVNQEAIANLISVFRIAQKRTLKILLTLFVGHMSGENWAPTWLTKKTTNRKNPFSVIVSGKRTRFGIRNIYQDKKILAASSLLIKTIVYSSRTRILATRFSQSLRFSVYA